MDEIFDAIDRGEKATLSTAKIGQKYVGDGCTLIFPGQEKASAKKYKCISSAPLLKGDRVIIAEISGSYVILGKLGTPGTVYNMNKCPTDSNATAANCANWINTLMQALAGMGIITKNNW